MRQIYYTIRTLLRERGSNIIRIISLSLGLTIGVLLFSQTAFELYCFRCGGTYFGRRDAERNRSSQ